MREVITDESLGPVIGPFSPAIRAAGLVFTSGQVGIDPATGSVVEGSVREQAERTLRNVAAVLEAAGTSLDRVVKTTVFLKDLGDYAAMNEVYGRFFASAPPARTCVQAARLPLDVLVEIEAVALA
jgi:2-iminobutanoate/2-iminopropanoate deaminase